MKTTVRYEFDKANFLPKELDKQHSMVLTDPLVISATGDIVHFRLKEFFDSKALADAYSEHAEGKVFYAERLNTIIGRDHRGHQYSLLAGNIQERIFQVLRRINHRLSLC